MKVYFHTISFCCLILGITFHKVCLVQSIYDQSLNLSFSIFITFTLMFVHSRFVVCSSLCLFFILTIPRNVKASDTLYVTATNDNAADAVQVSVGNYFSSCQYFDTTTQLWVHSGCQVSDESTAVVTSCVCNHLTAFGGASIVSITDISFEDLDVRVP